MIPAGSIRPRLLRWALAVGACVAVLGLPRAAAGQTFEAPPAPTGSPVKDSDATAWSGEQTNGTGANVVWDNAAEGDPREHAQRQLQAARQRVFEARSAASEAKAELEAAARATNERPIQPPSDLQRYPAGRGDGPTDATAPSWGPQGERPAASGAVKEVESVRQTILELRAERRELLTSLTPAHPLVIHADLRLREYQVQLDELERAAAEQPSDFVAAGSLVAPQSHASSGDEAAVAERLDSALERWEKAHRALESAMQAESSAVERLATIANSTTETKTADVSESLPTVADARGTSNPVRKMSQPIVLAALMIALIVAAIAAVKLARVADDTLFADADDASSALSLPVVGVIPAAAPALARRGFLVRHRMITVVLQLAATVLVFAAVAFCVQNPASVWQFLTNPAEVLWP